MLRQKKIVFRWVVTIGALLLASCGGIETPVTVEQETTLPTSTTAPTPTQETLMTAQDTPASVGECEAPTTEITLGSPVNSEIVNDDQPPPEREFFCVFVPEGASSITFELTGMTSDLNLYIGYPDLETVQQGGFMFWFSEEQGVADEVLVIQPAFDEFVEPGSYYIEVSAEDFHGSSPFTLSVRTP